MDALPSGEVLKRVWDAQCTMCVEFDTRTARTSSVTVGDSGMPLRAWGKIPRRLPLGAALEVLLESMALSLIDVCDGRFTVAPTEHPERWLPS
jgi:hypothetical protein